MIHRIWKLWTICTFLGVVRFAISLDFGFIFVFFGFLIIFSIILPYLFMERENYELAGLFIILPTWFALNVAIYFIGGFKSQTFVALFPIFLMGMMILDKKAILSLLAISTINGLIVALLQSQGKLPGQIITMHPMTTFLVVLLIMILSGYILTINNEMLKLSAQEIRNLNLQTYTLNNERRMLIRSEMEIKGKVHDFKNKLQAIQMNVEMLNYELELDDAISAGETNTYYHIFNLIDDSKEDLNNILGYNFYLSESKLKPYRVSDIAKSLDDWLTYQVPVNIKYSTFFETNCQVQIDFEQFDDICINLIGNAIDAIGDNGRIDIYQECKTVSEMYRTKANQIVEPGRYEIITFRDNGEGIPIPNQDKIFFPNFSTKPTGSGIGLLQVRLLVEQHHGYIDFESKENEFTEFYIIIPHSGEN